MRGECLLFNIYTCICLVHLPVNETDAYVLNPTHSIFQRLNLLVTVLDCIKLGRKHRISAILYIDFSTNLSLFQPHANLGPPSVSKYYNLLKACRVNWVHYYPLLSIFPSPPPTLYKHLGYNILFHCKSVMPSSLNI